MICKEEEDNEGLNVEDMDTKFLIEKGFSVDELKLILKKIESHMDLITIRNSKKELKKHWPILLKAENCLKELIITLSRGK